MKNLLIFGLIAVLFSSCQEPEKRYFSDSAEIETLKEAIMDYESGNWDKWKSHFADTAKVFVNSTKSMPLAERAEGLKQMASMLSSYGFNHDEEFIEMVIDKKDETWVYYWATHNGTFSENGESIEIPVHLAVRFDNGKIIAEHVYYDATQMNKVMEEMTQRAMESTEEEIAPSE